MNEVPGRAELGAAAVIGRTFDDLGHLRHKDHRVEMTDDFVGRLLHTIEQDLFTQALTVDAGGLKDETHFHAMFAFATLIIGNETRDCERVLFCFMKIDDLPVNVRLKGSERRKKINGFEHAGLALRICTGKQNHPLWNVDIQTGETAEVGEGEVFEVHVFRRGEVFSPHFMITVHGRGNPDPTASFPILFHHVKGYCSHRSKEYPA